MCIWVKDENGNLLFVGDDQPEIICGENQDTSNINKEQIENALYDALMKYANNQPKSILDIAPRTIKGKN